MVVKFGRKSMRKVLAMTFIVSQHIVYVEDDAEGVESFLWIGM